jgi:hypothetical protein
MELSMALVRTDVSEKCIESIIRVERIRDLGTTLAVTSNRSSLTYGTQFNTFLTAQFCRDGKIDFS